MPSAGKPSSGRVMPMLVRHLGDVLGPDVEVELGVDGVDRVAVASRRLIVPRRRRSALLTVHGSPYAQCRG